MENKTDKRVIRTKKKLIDGLAELLKGKSFKDIKVNELTSISKVNRATFYLHYTDIDDFLRQTEDQLAQELTQIFDKKSIYLTHNGNIPAIQAVLEFIYANASILSAILGSNGDPNFSYRLASAVRNKIISKYMSKGYEDLSDYYSMYYVIDGCTGVILKWIDGGMKESLKDMSQAILMFTINVIK